MEYCAVILKRDYENVQAYVLELQNSIHGITTHTLKFS